MQCFFISMQQKQMLWFAVNTDCYTNNTMWPSTAKTTVRTACWKHHALAQKTFCLENRYFPAVSMETPAHHQGSCTLICTTVRYCNSHQCRPPDTSKTINEEACAVNARVYKQSIKHPKCVNADTVLRSECLQMCKHLKYGTGYVCSQCKCCQE